MLVDLSLFERIRIESLGGNDIIIVETLTDYTGGLDIDTGAGEDVILHEADASLSGGADVTYRAELIEFADGSTIATGDTGSIALLAGRQILGDGILLSTVDGDLILEANADGSTSGNFTAIDLDQSSMLAATGSGTVSLTGHGGDTGNHNRGIQLDHGTTVCVVDGNLSLIGTGGDGHNHNEGIFLDHGVILEATGGGSLTLSGQGGDAKQHNAGIYVGHGSLFRTLSGYIELLGVGGDSSGNFNHGIEIFSSDIESVDGDISIYGIGGDGKKFNHGLVFRNSTAFSLNGVTLLDGMAGGGSRSEDVVF